jgi:hypothetical protein
MDPWTALGILLLGAGIGALLTAVAHARQVRELREPIHHVAADREKQAKSEQPASSVIHPVPASTLTPDQ